ncbi:MAG: iron-sulfur cluster assembly scaffold protein [Rhizobium sp.]|nr:iron-sulfur cluster assembly scaffold protein [Rhizobium sp.]
MGSDAFSALYRDQVLAHGRQPRQAGRLEGRARRASANNALCGDRVAVSLRLGDDGAIAELRHDSEGCLLCLASASLMASRVPGLAPGDVEPLANTLREALSRGDDTGLGELAALIGAAPYPSRHRCALLPWDALLATLDAPESEA